MNPTAVDYNNINPKRGLTVKNYTKAATMAKGATMAKAATMAKDTTMTDPTIQPATQLATHVVNMADPAVSPTVSPATMVAPTIRPPTIRSPTIAAKKQVQAEPEVDLNTVIMAGSQDFVNKCIDAFLEKRAKKEGGTMSGSFGTVERIVINNTPYFAKYIDTKVVNKRLDLATKNVMDEIDTAIYLTKKIPKYASNLAGGLITITHDEKHVIGFMVFEAPNGMNLEEFIKRYPPNNHKYARGYEFMYCLVKRAQVALNKLGFVHRDIKPANIYVIVDNNGQPINCKLIDFGLTVKEGYGGNLGGSPFWMPPNLRRYMDTGDLRGYKASHTHNDFSTSTIWSSDFMQGNRPEPYCGLGDARPERKVVSEAEARRIAAAQVAEALQPAQARDPRALIMKMATEAEAKRLAAAQAAPKKKWWMPWARKGGKRQTKKHRANKKSKSTRRRF